MVTAAADRAVDDFLNTLKVPAGHIAGSENKTNEEHND
jgi:hypothetical protein